MSIAKLYFDACKNAFNFTGKICRSDYWRFFACNLCLLVLGVVLFAIFWNNERLFGSLAPFIFRSSIISIALPLFLFIAITCRRLNDVNKSKLWFLPAGCVLFFTASLWLLWFWPASFKLLDQLKDFVFLNVLVQFLKFISILVPYSAIITIIFCASARTTDTKTNNKEEKNER